MEEDVIFYKVYKDRKQKARNFTFIFLLQYLLKLITQRQISNQQQTFLFLFIKTKPNPPDNMGLSNEQQILVPCKFISIMLHLIVTTMNYFSYHDNILSAYPELVSKDSTYQGAKTSFLASNTLIVIFLAFQIVMLFLGVNMFREKLSVFGMIAILSQVSTLHILGAILGAAFTFSYWQFDFNWVLWFLFSIIPVTCEVFTICTTPKKTL